MTKVRRGFLDSLLILGHSISRPLHSRLWQFFWFMVSAHAHPTFELSYAVPLLAKTAARERNCCSHVRNPLPSGNPLPYLTGEVPDHVLHDVVLVLDLPLHFWLMLYYFPFLWSYYCSFLYIVIAGGCHSHRLYSHGCNHKVKPWPALFGVLTVDHAGFRGFDHWLHWISTIDCWFMHTSTEVYRRMCSGSTSSLV